jgi:hypothetical protein
VMDDMVKRFSLELYMRQHADNLTTTTMLCALHACPENASLSQMSIQLNPSCYYRPCDSALSEQD